MRETQKCHFNEIILLNKSLMKLKTKCDKRWTIINVVVLWGLLSFCILYKGLFLVKPPLKTRENWTVTSSFYSTQSLQNSCIIDNPMLTSD